MRQTICEGVLESTIGNTPSKEASAFISMSNHLCIIKGKFIVFIKKQLCYTVMFTVNSSCPWVSSSIWPKKPQQVKSWRLQVQRAGLQRGLQPPPPYPGWRMLPRAPFFSTSPLATPLGPGLHLLLTAASENQSLAQPCPGLQRCKEYKCR